MTWKVQIQLLKKQIYICTIEDPMMAGVIFDVVSIQFRCSRAKTNFNYGVFEVLAVLFEPSLILLTEFGKNRSNAVLF